jgi:hypothetical protein
MGIKLSKRSVARLSPASLHVSKRSKYGVRTDAAGKAARTVDGILFASAKEARRYANLKLLQLTGKISLLHCQPRFELHATAPDGSRVKIGEYVADFRYFENGNAPIIEDVKGVQTDLFVWKRKHVEAEYGITVRIV